MAPDPAALPQRTSLHGSFSIDQIRRWALAGLVNSANNPRLIALLKHHLDVSREALAT
jgi:hypothetical protein